jgi:prepilin-type N-terminal cleavage/methylation domain-containing protein
MNLEQRKAGFTLIELLAVILIIGILATILITQLGAADEASKRSSTAAKISMLQGVVETYINEFGGAPSSSFTAEQGVSNDGTNVGIEALVVTLWSKGWEGGGVAGDFADELVNTDGDASGTRLTDFDTRDLLEISDAFGNPVAYISHRDYEITNRAYVTFDTVTGEDLRSTPVALKSSTTGRYYEFRNFQLISAGPDALFGTEDDITNFERD